MFCEECGSKLQINSKYCPKCGTLVVEDEVLGRLEEVGEIQEGVKEELQDHLEEVNQVEFQGISEEIYEDKIQEAIQEFERGLQEPDKELSQNEEGPIAESAKEQAYIQKETEILEGESAVTLEAQTVHGPVSKKGSKVVLIAGLTLLGICVLACVSFFVYILAFDYKGETKVVTLEEYIQENKNTSTRVLDENTMEFTADTSVLNAILLNNKDKIAQAFHAGVAINNLILDYEEEKVYINAEANKIKFPFSADIAFKVKNNALSITLDNLKLGALNVKAPSFIYKIFLEKTWAELNIDLDIPSVFNIDDIEVDKREIALTLSYNYDELIKAAKKIAGYIDNSALNTYYGKTDIQHYLYAAFSDNYGMGNDEELKYQLQNLMSRQKDQNVFPYLLALLDDAGINYIKSNYSMLINADAFKKEIEEIKSQIEIDQIMDESAQVFSAIEQYFWNSFTPYASSQLHLYDTVNKQRITPGLLKDHGYLSSDIYHFDHSYIVYDGGDYKIVYVGDTGYMEIDRYGDHYELTEGEFNEKYALLEADYGEAVKLYQQDSGRQNILDAISSYSYSGSEYYVRYLKADEKYAFALVSSKDDYQSVEQFLLEYQNNTWQVLLQFSSYEDTIQRVSDNFPAVNLDILPNYNVSDYNIKYLSGTTYVIDQLIQDGFITTNGYESPDGDTVVYASWIQDYVCVEISSGRRFFAYVDYYNYLTDVTEITSQQDIDHIIGSYSVPEMIFLQY